MPRLLLIAFLTWIITSQVLVAQDENSLTKDSSYQEGVPKGEIVGPIEWKSKIFPGTVRNYWLYVPKQYQQDKPACVFIVQDGLNRAKGWNLPQVLDNLIHKKEIPIQIGIFITPGVVPAPNDKSQPRFNRSFEYDGLGDRYARFLIEEIIPEVKKDYNLSDHPNDRMIGGASSGAICAFTAAWERPDQFRRVLSTIGTYVGLRGGDSYPVLIRKFEPKPLRVFLQDGSADLNLYGGEWFNANQSMLSALKFSNYEVNHAWGSGGHNSKHSAAIMPDILRWLWSDYPEPIKTGSTAGRRTDLLIPGEDWQEVSSGHRFTEGPVANDAGELFFTDIPKGMIYKLDATGKQSVFAEKSPGVNGLTFGPDGKLYACQNGNKQIVRYAMDGSMEVVCKNVESNDLVILNNGSGYFTDHNNKKVWHFTPEGEASIVDVGIARPNGVVTTPDQSFLILSDTESRFTYSFRIGPEGKLFDKQELGHLHLPDGSTRSGSDGMAVDTEGRIYVTTSVGLQILDQLGRVHCILNKPQAAWLSNVTFGGKDFNTLYVTIGDKVFKRKIKATGVQPWKAPVTPSKPNL
ncbi:SMP-30/gluconolactonase/LRE family protein [Planctomicrobium sp.]|jgi:gluconolactonase|nr:SMP-30/gluconolactonase/LRE family protein [Planctomicrobium sp.]MBT5017698.1 gluconolactonase [Planctomicrobium sp.]MDA7527403.1 SMP-30/gluconolactonase/LRE family protein [bacterium]MDB4743814.1 SMP-30/gluconolactonase/LRE family protein [Planctomicrobium sp.]